MYANIIAQTSASGISGKCIGFQRNAVVDVGDGFFVYDWYMYDNV